VVKNVTLHSGEIVVPLSAEQIAQIIGKELRRLRKESGKKFNEIDQETGISTGVLCQYENGSILIPYDRLIILANCYQKDIGKILDLLHSTPEQCEEQSSAKESINVLIGETIRAKRKALKLSLYQAVKDISLDSKTLSKIEKGIREATITEIVMIAKQLQTSVSDLLSVLTVKEANGKPVGSGVFTMTSMDAKMS
jgi:transcriptional regulator with XRE-family HTH domain